VRPEGLGVLDEDLRNRPANSLADDQQQNGPKAKHAGKANDRADDDEFEHL
jgi:hypothetical protein